MRQATNLPEAANIYLPTAFAAIRSPLMSLINYPSDAFSNLIPVPAGAAAGDWCDDTDFLEDVCRSLVWSRHDAAGVAVSVAGVQYADGRVDSHIVLDCRDAELTAAEARQLAAALLDAAECLEKWHL